MSSLRMPTARWVLPVPMPPTSNNPLPSRGLNSCTKRDALIWAGAIERSAPGKSVVKFESSQCSYRLGMRAAAIKAPPRACNWQSQRVTPRSGAPGTGFHPEPAHRGQTSAAVFIVYLNCLFRLCISTLHPNRPVPQPETVCSLCTSCGERRRVVENRDCGEPEKRGKPCRRPRTRTGQDLALSAHIFITADAAVRFRCQNRLLA